MHHGSSGRSQFGTALTFLLIGVGAGAITALLLAPTSGKELRGDIRRRYKDAKDAVEDFAEGAKDRMDEVLERGSEWMEDLEEAARKSVAPLGRAMRRRS